MSGHYVEHLETVTAQQDAKLAAVQTVVANLERTIAGKRMLLDSLIDGSSSSTELTREYVRINISELSRILDDLKQINT